MGACLDRQAEICEIELPEFGVPTVEPSVPAETFRQRLASLRDRAQGEGYNGLAVYADREHSANLAFLTVYDPRFEEALLVIDLGGSGRKPALMVGHEGWGYLGVSPIAGELEAVLFPSFSLMGQDRGGSQRLSEVLPFSNMPGYLPSCLLSPHRLMRMVGS